MKNLALAQKLEGLMVDIPSGYRVKVLSLDFSNDVREYADAIVHNLDGMIDMHPGNPLKAASIVGVFMATVIKMMKASFPSEKILAAYNITPEYLAIIIPDEYVRHDAITSFNEEMTELVKNYIHR